MNSTFRFILISAVVLAPIGLAAQTSADHPMTTMERYAHHDSLAAAARKAGNWAEYKSHLVVIDSILNGYPNVRVVMARADAHLGDTASAYRNLRAYAEMGLTRKIDADTLLARLHGSPTWDAIISRIAGNGAAVGNPERAWAMPDSDMIAEDIVYDSKGHRFFVSSVRLGKIFAVTPSGAVSTFAEAVAPGWGTNALAVDSVRQVLWATVESVPQTIGYSPAAKGKPAVLRFDLKSGGLLQRYDFPATEEHQAGDIALAPNGDLIVSDGLTGAIYVIPQGKSLARLVAPGELRSPQGPAAASDGKSFYVADYTRGLARVDRTSGAVTWMAHPINVALNGIDGLTLVDARTLIGVQNGFAPNRLLMISLDATGNSVMAAKVAIQSEEVLHDPTHGVFIGRDYYFIANGGYGAFGDDGKVVAGEKVVAPVIARVVNMR